MISIQEYLMGRADEATMEPGLRANMRLLLERMNKVRAAYAKPMIVTSGYRRKEDNDKTANAAAKSKHMTCEAIDIADQNGLLWDWCVANVQLLKSVGLWLEDKRYTPTWVHFQCVAPKSGRRIFIPSTNPAIAPGIWNGKYDKRTDGA